MSFWQATYRQSLFLRYKRERNSVYNFKFIKKKKKELYFRTQYPFGDNPQGSQLTASLVEIPLKHVVKNNSSSISIVTINIQEYLANDDIHSAKLHDEY